MKKRISTILIVLVFFIGLLVLLYPTISNWYNEKMSSRVVSNYTEAVHNKNEDDFDEIMKNAKEYNQQLHNLAKEFISGKPESQDYINNLDVHNGMMGYITIDSLKVKLPILHGTGEDVLQTAVGHLEGSSLPTGDVGNNTVLTGHTGLPSAELFTDLNLMEIGDAFELNILNEVFTYEVFNILVVEPNEVDKLEPIQGKDIVTLVTCTPYGVNSHRLLVQGEQITIEEEIIVEPEEITIDQITWIDYVPLVAIPVIIVLLILIIIARKRNKQYKNSRFK